ncbi:MAG: alpha/beta hydrolase [Myxococcota bacterium]|nr:alpha/beta hydrolase [Myxococcota bacterium]
MPRASLPTGVQIEYDTFGDPTARPLLLIMGLGAQMIIWDEAFCAGLADAGHFVVRFDNRDVGLSSKFDHAGTPDVLALMGRVAQGEPIEVPYTLDDMADDAVHLLDALELEQAHLCGASMGGMIAQTVAIRHPGRVRSLTSVMSTTGNPEVPPATPEAMAVLLAPPPTERDEAIERAVSTTRVLSGPAFPFDEERIRARGERLWDRSSHREGGIRQLAAILAHGSRVEALRGVAAPTLVIHGDADPLVSIEGGRDTARSIPGAELRVIAGMGHDMHPHVWPEVIDALSGHSEKHEAR